MFASSISFTWERPTQPDAFVWEECAFVEREDKTIKGVLTNGLRADFENDMRQAVALVAKPDTPFERYAPLRDALALYRILAETEPTLEGILGFARSYGRLGKGIERPTVNDRSVELGESGRAQVEVVHSYVEPLAHWQTFIVYLRELVRIWDCVQAGNRKALAKVLRWEETIRHIVHEIDWHSKEFAKLLEDWHAARATGGYSGLGTWHRIFEDLPSFFSGLEPLDPKDPIELGTVWVLRCLAVGMEKLVTLQPRRDVVRERIVLDYQPISLLGAIYLQFALAINQETPARRCGACGRWFEVAPDRSRADRTTCSGTCRTRLHRARRRRAKRLRAAGNSLQHIAAKMETDVKTIKKWLE